MKTNLLQLSVLVMALTLFSAASHAGEERQSTESPDPVKLENPITVKYLRANLKKSSPRLVLTPALEKKLKAKLKSDPVVKNYYAAMKRNAADILKAPLLTRKMEGRRLLGTSREMLYRMNVLGMIYRIEKDASM